MVDDVYREIALQERRGRLDQYFIPRLVISIVALLRRCNVEASQIIFESFRVSERMVDLACEFTLLLQLLGVRDTLYDFMLW